VTAAAHRLNVGTGRVHRRFFADVLYRVNRLALYTILLSYVPGVFAVVAATLFGLYALALSVVHAFQAHHPPAPRALVFAGGLVVVGLGFALLCLVGLLPLFFRRVDEPPNGVRLNPREHTKLFALLERICKRLGVSVPEHCVLTPGSNAGICDLNVQAKDGTLSRERALIIGAGLVVHASVAELTTVLCHELAHAAAGDTRLSRLATRFLTSLAQQIHPYSGSPDAAEPGLLSKIILVLLLLYYLLYSLVYVRDRRYREYRADRIAAEICGPQNVRNMLIAGQLVGFVPELSIEGLWAEYVRSERDLHNVYAEHRERWAKLPDARRAAAEAQMFLSQGERWDTHPCLGDRIRNLGGIDAHELTAPEPATRLFRGWNGIEEKITRWIMSVGREMFQDYLRQLNYALAPGH
jgi:Zn-dependent protease with chaperone function